jgi:hypothetical protein
MVGDDTVRFCCTCSKNVYDLTAMEPDEAEAFLAQHVSAGGSLPCARIYRRRDGRVLTSECRAGESRRHLVRLGKTLAAGLAGVALAGGLGDLAMRPTLGPDEVEPVAIDLAPVRRMQLGGLMMWDDGHHDPAPDYDVNAALRSDESTRPEDLEEGSGPGRRRYVRDDPNAGMIAGTTTLVTDTTELELSAASRRRRHPAY